MPRIVDDHKKVCDIIRYLKHIAQAAAEIADSRDENPGIRLQNLFMNNKYLELRLKEAEEILKTSNEEEE